MNTKDVKFENATEAASVSLETIHYSPLQCSTPMVEMQQNVR